MRKLKLNEKNTLGEKKKISDEEMIFWGMTKILKNIVLKYMDKLDNDEMFFFKKKGINNPNSLIKYLEKYIESISQFYPNDIIWTNRNTNLVKEQNMKYVENVAAITYLSKKSSFERSKIYMEDYELIITLAHTREYYKEAKSISLLNETIKSYLNKVSPNITKLLNFMLGEVYFGELPNPKAYKPDIKEITLLIDNEGNLKNEKGYYSSFKIYDEQNNIYPAGICNEGVLYMIHSDNSGNILNIRGEKLCWKNTIVVKEDAPKGVYQIYENEIITNMRQTAFNDFIKDIEKLNLKNINIIKTLIEMKGYKVVR